VIEAKDLLKDIKEYVAKGSLNCYINGISYDSRKVQPGDVFVAIKGFKADGHDYILQAIANGAVAIVAERDITISDEILFIKVSDTRLALALMSRAFYGYPDEKLRLIGVTGTNGKTSVTYMVKSVLEYAGRRVGLIGTIQNMIGDRAIYAERTTPESLDLYKLLNQMVQEDIQDVVMEVSSHSLVLNRIAGCIFDVGVFTNLTEDHLDFHRTMEDYFAAKLKLFYSSNAVVTNLDDPYGREIYDIFKDHKLVTYAVENNAQITASDIKSDARGSVFNMNIDGAIKPVKINIPGYFSIYNALAAAGACHALAIEADDIAKGLGGLKGVPGRFEVLDTPTDFTVIIDYAHTPDGLENILKSVKKITQGRVIALFGCGGDRDPIKRAIMGEIAGRYADFCIITSDNPRSEEPMAIIRQIEEGIRKTRCPYVIIENRKEAIKYGLHMAEKNDVLLLAGKGHETYQILRDKTIHFDEREIVHELLEEMKR